MNSRTNTILPIKYQALILFTDHLFVFGLLISMVNYYVFSQIEDNQFQVSFTNLMVVPLGLTFVGLLRTFFKITLLQKPFKICKAVMIGKIEFPKQFFFRSYHKVLRMTFEYQQDEVTRKTKHFYFVNEGVIRNDYDYYLLFSMEKPNRTLLLNNLPKGVQSYIR